jgi:hypothetical protein
LVRKEKQKQTERGKEVEEAGGNVLKADSKKRIKGAEEKCGDLGNV